MLIETLLTLLILAIVLGLVYWAVTMLPLPPPVHQIVVVIFVVICIVLLLGFLFGGIPYPKLSIHHGAVGAPPITSTYTEERACMMLIPPALMTRPSSAKFSTRV